MAVDAYLERNRQRHDVVKGEAKEAERDAEIPLPVRRVHPPAACRGPHMSRVVVVPATSQNCTGRWERAGKAVNMRRRAPRGKAGRSAGRRSRATSIGRVVWAQSVPSGRRVG